MAKTDADTPLIPEAETEARNPDSEDLDELTTLELAQRFNRADASVAGVVAGQLPEIARAIDLIAERMGRGGRLIYMGAGTSGRLGVLDASECPPTFGASPEQVVGVIAGGETALTRSMEGVEDDQEAGAQAVRTLQVNDLDSVMGISASGRNRYLLGALAEAAQRGALVISLVCASSAPIEAFAQVRIAPITGPEVITGSTRLKAGTAQKMILNMISTGVMVRLGKTYGNLMVSVPPANLKLRRRGQRIVSQATGLPEEKAQAVLQSCSGEVSTAIVSVLAEVSPSEARLRLQRAGGSVRRALQDEQGAQGFSASTGYEQPLVLGIDGGQTGTRGLLVTTGGQVLGEAAGGPILHLAAAGSQATFTRSLAELVRKVWEAAGLPPQPLTAAGLGLTGVAPGSGDPGAMPQSREAELAAELFQRLVTAGTIAVQSDAFIALKGAHAGQPGVVINAGTGTIVLGTDASGRVERCGGWGWLLGDEGSASAIGRQALQSVARAWDGAGPQTNLVEAAKEYFQIATIPEMKRLVIDPGFGARGFGRFAPWVARAAGEGDTVARQIIQEAGLALAQATVVVLRKLDFAPSPAPVAPVGGAFNHVPGLKEVFLEHLWREVTPAEVEVRDRLLPPVMGAVLLALESCAAPLPAAIPNLIAYQNRRI